MRYTSITFILFFPFILGAQAQKIPVADLDPVGKKYEMQTGMSCAKMVDGGCTFVSYTAMSFRADSVDIWAYEEAHCVPRSRGRQYAMTGHKTTYAWSIRDHRVCIDSVEGQNLSWSAAELEEMGNQAIQRRKHYYLIRFSEDGSEIMGKLYGGYLNQDGDTIIPMGRYAQCYSDTIWNFGIVGDRYDNYWALDNKGKVMYGVCRLESREPDTLSEGLFRIFESDGSYGAPIPPFAKVGYANSEGNIIIKPTFAFAEPFRQGKAQATHEFKGPNGMADPSIEGKNWFLIDRKGNRVE